jgi:uncharacterized radical SAM protein YgiQ
MSRAAFFSYKGFVMSANLFSYKKHWAHRLLPASVLPRSRAEMDELGWDACDVILITGDAYVDHPSFGVAVIGRVLEAQGFRVGIIDQPNPQDSACMQVLGAPLICFGVTSGNMDSMVNHYTADGRIRSNDAYTPDDEAGRRPDRATIVYTNLCKAAYPGIPVILGGIEASLRRAAHYDYWSDKVRRSILVDAKADLICYGNAERAIVEVVHRLAKGDSVKNLTSIAGTAFLVKKDTFEGKSLRLPSFEEVLRDKNSFLKASQIIQQNSYHPGSATLLQAYQDRDLCLTPPAAPLSTCELDRIYELPFTRRPHPAYQQRRLTAYEMIRNSITIMRGCFGGCSFCAIVSHEGPTIQSRSEESILKEIEMIRDQKEGFSGVISDLGGPTANMYRMGCERHLRPTGAAAAPHSEEKQDGHEGQKTGCRRWSCLAPKICPFLGTNHTPLIKLYRRARALPGIKKILIGSGVRYDLAGKSPEYIKELVTHHVGGYLKIAPEHVSEPVLKLMQKPDLAPYEQFKNLFDRYCAEAGKEQYLIPYLIAAHPGCEDRHMLEAALWLKKNGYRPDQVQTFLPTPMTLATTMYYTGKNPLQRGSEGAEEVYIPRGLKQRRLQKAFLRYHDAENWPVLRETLKKMGREDLIGNGKHHLIPNFQPQGTGKRPEGARHTDKGSKVVGKNDKKAFAASNPACMRKSKFKSKPKR